MPGVVQISFYSDPAGRDPAALLQAWPTLVHVAEAASKSGVPVTVLQASSHRDSFARHGVDYHFLPFGGTAATSTGRAAAHALVDGLRPDVLHVQGLGFAQDVLALAAALPDYPIVLQDHADRPPRRPWHWPLWRRGLSAARGVMFCTREQARPLQRAGLLPARLPVYEVPESTCLFEPGDQLSARQASGLTGSPCLLWVGHLNDNKDPLTVLAGVSLAARHLPGLQLWCCFGNAPRLPEVRATIARDPLLRGRVHLLGEVPHARIETLMRAADGLVQGSRRESSGYSVIEALACGLPPVVTDIPSFRALTGGGAAGRLWRCGDPRSLASALLALAAAAPAQARAAARRQFEQHLSQDALGRRLRAVYAEVAQGRPR